jgi:hypothetical protein
VILAKLREGGKGGRGIVWGCRESDARMIRWGVVGETKGIQIR